MAESDGLPRTSHEADDTRMSTDEFHDDHELLDEEDEQQAFLRSERRIRGQDDARDAYQGFKGYSSASSGRRNRKTKAAKKELVHEMEEGGPASRSSSSDGASDYEREKKSAFLPLDKKQRKRKGWFSFTALNVLICVLFVAIAFGAYSASKETKQNHDKASQWRSNGTSLFAPTTILISLDGFRADFLQRNLTPTLNRFISDGVSPKYMTPSFPSLTFPNHYTLVTGLHPESHGIVANTFWDDDLQESFAYTDRAHSMQPKWWYPHPLWETAELQGVRTAIHMWPGSEASIGEVQPMLVDKYNGSEVLSRKVDRVLGWLDRPGARDAGSSSSNARPQLVAAYVPDVDRDGHNFGPNSTEIRSTIASVDGMLELLFSGLEERNLTNIVNVVVVSDHGMATTSNKRLVQFEDLVDPSLIAHIDGWPHYGLRPHDPNEIAPIYAGLQDEAKKRDGFEVYLKKDIPERYHFQNSSRIAPLWIFAKTGWAIVTKDEYNVAKGVGGDGDVVYHPRGIHGYDNEHPLMRAIFVARGPAFPHPPGSRVENFQNTEVYNVVCDSLGIEPLPNNGTLRLPLTTAGVHGDDSDPVASEDSISDAPENTEAPQSPSPSPPQQPGEQLGQPAETGETDEPPPERPVSPPRPTDSPSDNNDGEEEPHRPGEGDPGRHYFQSLWEYVQWLKEKMKSSFDKLIHRPPKHQQQGSSSPASDSSPPESVPAPPPPGTP